MERLLDIVPRMIPVLLVISMLHTGCSLKRQPANDVVSAAEVHEEPQPIADTSITIGSMESSMAFNLKRAQRDIDSNTIHILFPGGFLGIPDFNNPKDTDFQDKYHVTFFAQGCIRSGLDNEDEYNRHIFKYLDKKYGKQWRAEIRDDAIALDE